MHRKASAFKASEGLASVKANKSRTLNHKVLHNSMKSAAFVVKHLAGDLTAAILATARRTEVPARFRHEIDEQLNADAACNQATFQHR